MQNSQRPSDDCNRPNESFPKTRRKQSPPAHRHQKPRLVRTSQVYFYFRTSLTELAHAVRGPECRSATRPIPKCAREQDWRAVKAGTSSTGHSTIQQSRSRRRQGPALFSGETVEGSQLYDGELRASEPGNGMRPTKLLKRRSREGKRPSRAPRTWHRLHATGAAQQPRQATGSAAGRTGARCERSAAAVRIARRGESGARLRGSHKFSSP